MSPDTFGGWTRPGSDLDRESGGQRSRSEVQNRYFRLWFRAAEKILSERRIFLCRWAEALERKDQIVAKPPPSPPHSDITGVDRDRAHRLAPETFDAKAQKQLAAENRESIGRPDQGAADQPKDDPKPSPKPSTRR